MNNLNSTTNNQTPKLLIAIVSAVVIAAILTGGVVYLIQKRVFDKERQELEERIEGLENQTSKESLMEYIKENITEIVSSSSSFVEQPANGTWYAIGFGFTSNQHVYVDFEDGHSFFRTLLECSNQNGIRCHIKAFFDDQGRLITGTDTQKDNPIIYSWAQDYEWQRDPR